jgi:hypothetical protein
MGIFNKKPPKAKVDDQPKSEEAVKCPKCGTSLDVNGKCLNGHRTEAKPTDEPQTINMKVTKEFGLKVADAKGEIRTIAAKFPKGFDPSNQEAVKKFIIDALKEAGELPEGATVDGFEVESLNTGANRQGAGDIAAMLSHFLSMKTGADLKDIPQPPDPPKAEFIRCFNAFHRHQHEMAPLAADLLQSLECMKLNLEVAGVSDRDREKFKMFEGLVAEAIEALGRFGEMTCTLHSKVGERGLPVPDSTSNTIN